jgi:hypothetical protein
MKNKGLVLLIFTSVIGASAFLMAQTPIGTLVTFEVTCGTTATALKASGQSGYRTVRCANTSTTKTVYVGGSNVTDSNGYPVGATAAAIDGAITLDAAVTAPYCIVAAADTSQTMRCITGK